MQFISRKFHALLDYISGIILVIAPGVFNFHHVTAATVVSVFSGILILVMAIVTDYEGGLTQKIPMFMHLNVDMLLGVFLCMSPATLGFSEVVYLPHWVMGLLSLLAGLFTVRTSLSDAHKN